MLRSNQKILVFRGGSAWLVLLLPLVVLVAVIALAALAAFAFIAAIRSVFRPVFRLPRRAAPRASLSKTGAIEAEFRQL